MGRLAIFLAGAVMLAGAGPNAAAVVSPGAKASSGERLTMTLSPQQRGAAIGRFVRRWGPYVQQVYGSDVHVWAQRMVSYFAKGDALNIQRSLQRSTFDGAMAELNGTGKAITDDKVITRLATSRSLSAMALGSPNGDLVFTPITPCRIADTRLVGGPIAADGVRGFFAWGFPSYASWGGSDSDCGMLDEHPASVILNVTAVAPAGAGYATVFSGAVADASKPHAASINYAAGAIVNNSVVVSINPALAVDYKIYSRVSSNYVVDIVGFYAAPHATALDCVETSANTVTVPSGGTYGILAPDCAAGYVRTATNCHAPSMQLGDSGDGACSVRNTTPADGQLSASATCCRVPGR
jgi:hypothetical protein